MNKMKWDEGYPLLEQNNRSTNRFVSINGFVRRSCNKYYDRNIERERKLYQYLDLLRAVAGNQMNELFKDRNNSNRLIGEILPNLSDETIDELTTIYLIEEELKGNNAVNLHKSFDLPPIENTSKNIKATNSNLASPNKSSLLDWDFISPNHRSLSKLKEESEPEPTDTEIMEIVKQMNLDQQYMHLILDIQSIVKQLATIDKNVWRFRLIKNEYCWMNK